MNIVLKIFDWVGGAAAVVGMIAIMQGSWKFLGMAGVCMGCAYVVTTIRAEGEKPGGPKA